MSAAIPLTNDFDNLSDQNVERHTTNKTTFDSMGPSPSGNLNDSLVPSPSKPEYIEDSDEEIYSNCNDSQSFTTSRHTSLKPNFIATRDNQNISGFGDYAMLEDTEEIRSRQRRQLKRYWLQLILYITYNSIRFLTIGMIIFMVNHK